MGDICLVFFSRVGKSLSYHCLAKWCARILVGFHGVVERRRFLRFDTVEYFINLQWRRRLNANGVLEDL